MTVKQISTVILALILTLCLLGGCSSLKSPDTASGEAALLTVVSGDQAVPTFKAFRSGLSYSEHGWIAADGSLAEYYLREAYESLPTVTVTSDFQDFKLEYAPNAEPMEACVFSTEFKHIYEALYRPESLTALPRGTYYITIGVRLQGQFIESENKHESASYHCMFRLVVE